MADHFRAYPRQQTRVAMSARLDGGTAPPVHIIDVSMGGAGIRSGATLDVGARVDIVLQMPNRWDPLVLPARVAWSKGDRAGLAFEHRDDRDVYALFEMLGVQTFDR